MKDSLAVVNTIDSTLRMSDTTLLLKNTKTVSLFQNHLLVSTNPEIEIISRNVDYDYGITAVILVLFVFFVWLYSFNAKTINQLIVDFFQISAVSNFTRKGSSIGNGVSIISGLFFIVSISIIIGDALSYFDVQLFYFNVVEEPIIAVLLLLMYAVKILIVKFLGHLFKVQNVANSYAGQILSFCNTLGLFLLPVIILLSFYKQVSPLYFIYISVGLITVFVVIRLFKGFLLGLNSSKISGIYLFMYLCTLEILPFVVITKLVMLNIS